MTLRRVLVCFVLITGSAAAADRSISTSRQFIVYGGDVRLRGAICDLAEETKKNLLALIGQRDEWRVPIVINADVPQANFPEAPSAHLQLAQSEAGLKLQLELRIGADLQAPNVERELLRALLIELMYRDAPAPRAGTAYVEPPAWLTEGIVAHEREREAGAQLLEPLVSEGKTIPLGVFLEQRPESMDPPSLRLYRAYSAALVDLLMNSSDASQRLAQFIRDLRQGSVDPVADLVIHFPQLHGMSGVAEVWSQHLVEMAARERYQLLGVAETEQTLNAMLRLGVGETSYSIDDFARLLQLPRSHILLRRLSDQLLLFEPRANPVYRGIVVEYHEIAMLLARGSTKHVAERLGRVKEWRQQLATRMNRIDDYLNWYEATQQTTRSGLFDDYIKAAEATEKSESQRRDRISVYLDAIENQL